MYVALNYDLSIQSNNENIDNVTCMAQSITDVNWTDLQDLNFNVAHKLALIA